jgi:GNAT superfamily N-acetyltransferase
MSFTAASAAAAATFSIPHCPTRLIETLPLAGGRCARLRPVLPQDEALMQSFLAGLPANRQGGRTAHIDYLSEMALVATVSEGEGDAEEERIVADARYLVGADGRSATVSMLVADDWAGCGIEPRLMSLLEHCARRAGIRCVRGNAASGPAGLSSRGARGGWFGRLGLWARRGLSVH